MHFYTNLNRRTVTNAFGHQSKNGVTFFATLLDKSNEKIPILEWCWSQIPSYTWCWRQILSYTKHRRHLHAWLPLPAQPCAQLQVTSHWCSNAVTLFYVQVERNVVILKIKKKWRLQNRWHLVCRAPSSPAAARGQRSPAGKHRRLRQASPRLVLPNSLTNFKYSARENVGFFSTCMKRARNQRRNLNSSRLFLTFSPE